MPRLVVSHWARAPLIGFHNTVIVDGFALIFAVIFLAATALAILLSMRFLDIEQEQEGEYYALILLACIGMMFMSSGIDLIVLFLGLETMALSFYVLTGFLRREKRSNEAALKYLSAPGATPARAKRSRAPSPPKRWPASSRSSRSSS